MKTLSNQIATVAKYPDHIPAFNVTLELGRTIKNHGKIGKYYLLELCCGLLDYARFSKALDVLKDQDLIIEDKGLLIWKG